MEKISIIQLRTIDIYILLDPPIKPFHLQQKKELFSILKVSIVINYFCWQIFLLKKMKKKEKKIDKRNIITVIYLYLYF